MADWWRAWVAWASWTDRSDWTDWTATLGDLASYRPSDFLMFAPRTYWRLFELHNEAWWPAPLVLPALGLAACAWIWRGGSGGRGGRGGRGGALAQRAVAAALAVASLFVAQAFVIERYEPINWAARGLAWLLWAQAVALAGLACTRGLGVVPEPRRRLAALALAAWALAGHPLLALASGRSLMQAEVFGLAPDPTAIAMLAWLLQGSVAGGGLPARLAWRAAWALALAACALSAATLATMGELQAAVMAAAALVAFAASRRR